MAEPRPTLCAAIIAKNEERNLPRCLRSVRWADEIVLVDDCSTDRTPDIAREFGCTVITNPLRDFSDQRNLALRHCTSEWVFHIDADEECPPALRDEILGAIRNTSFSGFRVPCRNRFLAQPMRCRDWAMTRPLRLARRETSRWVRPVHEILETAHPVGDLQSPLDHFGEADYAARVLKSNLYSSLEAGLLAARGRRFSTWCLLALPLFRALRSYFLAGGWRDGVRGVFWAGHVWWGNFTIHLKLWELEQAGPQEGGAGPPGGPSRDR